MHEIPLSDIEGIKSEISKFCRIYQILQRISAMREELEQLEEEIERDFEWPIYDRLEMEEGIPSMEKINGVLAIIEAEQSKNGDAEALDFLVDVLRGNFPNDGMQAQ